MVGHEGGILRKYHTVSGLKAVVRMILTHPRTWIHGAAQQLKGKPLLDMVGGVIEDYEFLWDQYYFPTATM